MVKLFVVGISREMDEIELDQLFSYEGMVKRVTIIRDMQSGVSKGYAFVEMMDQTGAERAIRMLNGIRLGERVVSVRYSAVKNQPMFISDRSSESEGKAITFEKEVGHPSLKRPRRPRKV